MSKKREREEPSRWKGDAVEAQAGNEAERAAERAEGHQPVRADAEARRLSDPGVPQTEDDDRVAAPAAGDGDEKVDDVAEEHRASQAERGHGSHGKL